MTTRPTSAARTPRVMFPQRSKFGVNTSEAGKLARTYGGYTFASLAEMRQAQELDVRKLAGDILGWWAQWPIPLVVNGVKVAKMVCDFRILHKDKTFEFLEVKGSETAVWRLKLKLLKAVDPKIRYTVVKA